MARFDRLRVLNTVVNTGLMPVFYNGDVEVAKNIAKACVAGGSPVVEFTNRGDFAPEVFKELSRFLAKEAPGVILGVGSVVDEPTAALYIAYGANFVVGPILNASVARVCNRRKIPYMPGCGSASEISYAEELGVEIVKVFPGSSVGGPDFVKSILGPTPWTRIMPTGGVDSTYDSLKAWFKAGVAAVGMGSNLVTKEAVAASNWDAISLKVRQVLDWIKEVRGEPVFLGVEHVGLYPNAGASGQTIGEWYNKRFGFDLKEGTSSFFVSGKGPGRIEIMKAGDTDRCHVAVRVSNFEKAVEALKAQGVEFEEPKLKGNLKAIFLKERDPAGNIVHLLWQE
jgi:2-dehydro-3-deoxyphosphogluconate aldolase / (4S)-4-hydroxy-2-oxoglutarate aldolase